MINAGYSPWPSSQKANYSLDVPRGQVFILEQTSQRATFTPHRQGWTMKCWGRGTEHESVKPGIYEYVVTSFDPREEKYICLESPSPAGDVAIYCSQSTIVHCLASSPEEGMKKYRFKNGYPPNWDLDSNLCPIGREKPESALELQQQTRGIRSDRRAPVPTPTRPQRARMPTPAVIRPIHASNATSKQMSDARTQLHVARCTPTSKSQIASTVTSAISQTQPQAHAAPTSSDRIPGMRYGRAHELESLPEYPNSVAQPSSYPFAPSSTSSSHTHSFLEPENAPQPTTPQSALTRMPSSMPTSASSFLPPEVIPVRSTGFLTPEKKTPRIMGDETVVAINSNVYDDNAKCKPGGFSPSKSDVCFRDKTNSRAPHWQTTKAAKEVQFAPRQHTLSLSSGEFDYIARGNKGAPCSRDEESEDYKDYSHKKRSGGNPRARQLEALLATTTVEKAKKKCPRRVMDPSEAKRIINSHGEKFGISVARRKSYNQPSWMAADDKITLTADDGTTYNVRVVPRYSEFAVHRKRDQGIFFPRGMVFIMRQEATTCEYITSLRTGFPSKVYEIHRDQYDVQCDPGVYEYLIAGWEPREEKYLCYEAGEIHALVYVDGKQIENAFVNGEEKESEEGAVTFEDQYPEQPQVNTSFRKLGYNKTENQKEVAAIGNFEEMSKYRPLDARVNFL
eukprot:GEMP01008282.1.p1 GENE.GEMP01008282.1~~GEMP01008282.1.p1  ORF type:complete len:679 (+),score=136.29 GEMP01008282.1:51-2087(+)